MRMETCCLHDLVISDHRARMAWSVVQRLGLSCFLNSIAARSSDPGRAATDPKILLSLWPYATLEHIGCARRLAKLCENHVAHRSLCGGVCVHHHTLSDFRRADERRLDDLLTHVITTLMTEDVVRIDRINQDRLRVRTGEEIWRTPREEEPTWSTPTIHVGVSRTQVICNGWKHMGGYDITDGRELWKLVGGGDIPVPTPVVAGDLIYITNAHGRMAPIYAIRTDAEGALEAPPDGSGNQHVAWAYSRRGNYMQTPIIYKGLAYFCSDAGILSCYDAQTGEQHYRERLGEGRAGFTSSPVAGDDKLYFTSEEGQVHIIRPGTSFEKLAVIDLGETHMSTPAIAEGVIYFRTRGHLIAVGSN